MVDFSLVHERTAFINVDKQNCFIDSPIAAPDGLVILERINRLATACRKAGILVIHTRELLKPDGANAGLWPEFFPLVTKGIVNKGSESDALHKALVVKPSDILLEKPRFGAFYCADLELILRSRRIDTLIIGGIATNVCCETTARKAAVRNFRVFFLSDGTATTDLGRATAQELQKATCATLDFLFAQVLTVDEMLRKVEGATNQLEG